MFSFSKALIYGKLCDARTSIRPYINNLNIFKGKSKFSKFDPHERWEVAGSWERGADKSMGRTGRPISGHMEGIPKHTANSTLTVGQTSAMKTSTLNY